MNEKAQLRRITKLGINDFETAGDVGRMQKDMLRRLKRSSVDPDHYAGLANCRLDYCGRVNCLRRVALARAAAGWRQFWRSTSFCKNATHRYTRFALARGVWARPFGKLQEASIEAAKQLSRRALDTLYDNRIVAVGAFKVSAGCTCSDDGRTLEMRDPPDRSRSEKGGFGSNLFHATRPRRAPQCGSKGFRTSDSRRDQRSWSDHQRSAQAGSQRVAASLAR